VIDRRLELVGIDRPILDGQGRHEIMTVTAPGVVVRGFEFRNVGVSYVEDRAGIRVSETRDCVIADNRFVDAFFAIYLANVRTCTVHDNEIVAHSRSETSAGNGIHLWHSDSVHIVGNRIRGERDGIYFEFVHDSDVERNLSTENLRYGLHFMFSDGCRYRSNVFRRNGAGVAVMYSKHVVMTDNAFEDSRGTGAYGLLLREITDSRVDSNAFSANTLALHGDGASRLSIRGNLFADNGWALRLMASSVGDSIEGNAFIRNSFDFVTNSERVTSTLDGNYWDSYHGYDLDRDGFGDVPYHPERFTAAIVDAHPASMALLGSPLLRALDMAERVLPILTPAEAVDPHPVMRAPRSLPRPPAISWPGESANGGVRASPIARVARA
jgi:nitrous oxidase accessory protein